jgi:hypothetical protein
MSQFAHTPPPLPTSPGVSGISVALIVLMWVAWVGVLVLADAMAFLMFAFADSPDAGKAAQAMIVPVFGWFLFTFVAGILLLIFRGWWQVPLAFVLAISPPFFVFAGYNLLSGKSATPNIPPPPPAQTISIPPGEFVPTTLPTIDGPYKPNVTIQQPDFQKAIDAARQAATRPSEKER